jgi:hypothetical protein
MAKELELDPTERDLVRAFGLEDDDAPAQEDPHWLRDALALPFVERLRQLAVAVWFFVRAPHRFGAAWFSGASTIPNPLVAMAASVSIMTILGQEVREVLTKEPVPRTLLSSIIDTLGPYALYFGIGLVAHLVLRTLGSKRKLRTTMGLTLLTGAGPGIILALGIGVPPVVLVKVYGSVDTINTVLPLPARIAILVSVVVLYLGFLGVYELALAGAHGVARWKGVVAGTVAVIAMAFATGALEKLDTSKRLTGSLGAHLSLQHGDKGMSFGFRY